VLVRSWSRRVVCLLLLVLGLQAGCGGNGELTAAEFETAYQAALRPLFVASADKEVQSIALGNTPYTVERGRAVMSRLARIDKKAADDLDALEAPRDAEEAVSDLISALRNDAANDQRAADDRDLSEKEVHAAICCTSPAFESAVDELARLGYQPLAGIEK
jgi:hypothetical protein